MLNPAPLPLNGQNPLSDQNPLSRTKISLQWFLKPIAFFSFTADLVRHASQDEDSYEDAIPEDIQFVKDTEKSHERKGVKIMCFSFKYTF